jgi:Flp pilus assembly protein TadG
VPASPATTRSISLRSESGQAVIEFALVLPILLLLIFGAFDLSRAFGYWNDVNQIAAERARAAATGRVVDAIGNGGLSTVTDDGINVTVTCTITERVDPGVFGGPGDAVTVDTEASFEHIGVVAAILGLTSDGQINGSATMRLERDASDDADVCDA